MGKTEIINKLRGERLVAVIRGSQAAEVKRTVKAVCRGGIRLLEITFTIPAAERIIADLNESYRTDSDLVIGAGTCMDVVSARLAISAGARFVVCPHLDIDILKLCNSYAIPCFPGCATVRDMHEALSYGAEIIKLFPGDLFGPSAIRAFHGPLPRAEFMPTGGVNAANIIDWLEAGAIAVGTGGSLTRGAASGDFDLVTREAAALVNLVDQFRRRTPLSS